jgi:hypothetical protein
MLKQGARPARSRSQTNKFFGQNREATTEGNLPVTTTISEDYAFPAGHAARGRSASPRCSRRRTASGISPFWRRSCVRTPWAPWRESRSVWLDNGVQRVERMYRVPPRRRRRQWEFRRFRLGRSAVAVAARALGHGGGNFCLDWAALRLAELSPWAFPALDLGLPLFLVDIVAYFLLLFKLSLEPISYARRRNDDTDAGETDRKPSLIV